MTPKRLTGVGLSLLAVGLGTGAHLPNPVSIELKYEQPHHLSGAIYARDGKQLLFKFDRLATRSGTTLKVERDFTYPNGKLAARERVIYEGDALASYELVEAQTGASGRARIRRTPEDPVKGTIEFEYVSKSGSRPKVNTEALQENTLVADMVGTFLAAHWAALARGEKIKCRYIVVPRRETVGFTFSRDAESPPPPGQKAVTVRMEPSSRFVAALVDPLFFTIEQAPPHRVLQYVGRTTPKTLAGSRWKDLDAVTVFDWESAR